MPIDVLEATNTLDALLDRVELGEEVVITREGKPIARLVPIRSAHHMAKARAAVEQIAEMRKGVTLGGLKIKDFIEEGRK